MQCGKTEKDLRWLPFSSFSSLSTSDNSGLICWMNHWFVSTQNSHLGHKGPDSNYQAHYMKTELAEKGEEGGRKKKRKEEGGRKEKSKMDGFGYSSNEYQVINKLSLEKI